MDIWFIRHGESKAQTEEEYSFDSNLTELGVQQANRLQSAVAGIDFYHIFISPLRRARQTFECLNISQNISCEFDSRLIEFLPDYSSLLPYEELPDYATPDRYNAWLDNRESGLDDFYRHIKTIQSGRPVLIVAHGGVIQYLLDKIKRDVPILKDEIESILEGGIKNGSLTKLLL
jgi:broad specificity phosphatase PhoE